MFWHRRPQAKGYPYLRLRLAFEAGYGLCLHHAMRARALLAPGDATRIIAVVTRVRLAVLGWELE